ncbi:MAG: response regulator [Acetobacteraceae bacterium]|nr:response regulator [Acetobacteraceae bacterium]
MSPPKAGPAGTMARRSIWQRLSDGIRLQYLLFVALTAVAAIPVLTLDIWEAQASFEREVDSVRERHLLVARNLTSTMSRYVVDIKAVFMVAIAPGTLNPDTPGLTQLLDLLDFVHVCVFAADGTIEAFLPVKKLPTPQEIGARGIADLRALAATRTSDGGNDGPILSNLRRDPNGRPAFYLVKALPNGRLAVGEVTTEYLVRLQSVIAFGERGHAVITDANGLAIAHPFKEWVARMQDLSAVPTVKKMMARQTGVDQFYSPAFKDDMIAGFSFVPESGWGVMVPQPLSELKRRAREIDLVAWVVGGVALAVASVLSLIIASFLASPVRRVAATADAILAGDTTAKVPEFVGLVPREIRRLGRAFNTMVESLQRRNAQTREALKQAELSNNAKSQFLANISHEIRTPLNGMLGMVELLRQTALDDRQQRFAETVTRSGTALLGLINDILDLSKIEAGKLELEHGAFNLATVVAEAHELFIEPARAKGLGLDMVLPDALRLNLIGDQYRLRQVLTNLLGNAVKFTSHGQVKLVVSLAEDRGAVVVLKFEVSDTGIGVSAAKQAIIFDAFAQVDGSSTREFGGTGLGLSIVKQICAMMGGEVGVRSEVGVGSTFWFTATLRKGAPLSVPMAGVEPRRSAQIAAASGRKAVRVLLVEDNAVNMEVGRGLLQSLGCIVTSAVDGQDAVDLYRSGLFDLVLMDLQMPRMDGFAATTAIRAAQQRIGDKTPVLALSAHALPGDRAKSLSAGFDEHLTKPVTRAVLAEAIAAWVPSDSANLAADAQDQAGVGELAVIDPGAIGRLREIETAGNEGLVHRVLQQFLADGEALVNEIARAMTAGDHVAVRQAAHTLKSSSAYLGADRLRTCCVRIEEAAANADGETENGLLISLRIEYVRASTKLTSLLGGSTPL